MVCEDEPDVKVACVEAGRALGFGSSADGGICIRRVVAVVKLVRRSRYRPEITADSCL